MLCLLAVMIITGRPYTSGVSYTNDLPVLYSARTVSSVTSSALRSAPDRGNTQHARVSKMLDSVWGRERVVVL